MIELRQTSLERRLVDAALALRTACSLSQAQTLLTYMAQMQHWNRTYNLTALREADQILVQHLFDSLAIVAPMCKALSGRVESGATIVDVGSGAGLPGVVLATVQSGWQVHCVDAVEKKMAFVRQMSGVLQLGNLHAIHARVEKMAPLAADIVVSRAFASLRDFAILAGDQTVSGGHLLAMKGHEPLDEIKALESETDWRVDRIESLIVPELSADRCLVWMSRR
jgi:16S rRNA (guanine527-N7)-methyltransferase